MPSTMLGAQLRLNSLPVMVEPTLDSLEPLSPIIVVRVIQSLARCSLGLCVIGRFVSAPTAAAIFSVAALSSSFVVSIRSQQNEFRSRCAT